MLTFDEFERFSSEYEGFVSSALESIMKVVPQSELSKRTKIAVHSLSRAKNGKELFSPERMSRVLDSLKQPEKLAAQMILERQSKALAPSLGTSELQNGASGQGDPD